MYKGKKIAVIVPAYNEEKFIATVIGRVPDYIDRIFVVDDASKDQAWKIASTFAPNGRVKVTRHERNSGVGRAIVTGYKGFLADGGDVAVVMAGDNQMDSAQLPRLLDPIVEDRADYAVGDRLSNSCYIRTGKCSRISSFTLD